MRSLRGERRRALVPRSRSGHPGVPAEVPVEPVRGRRSGGEAQDSALYTCHCGYVFQALVSTTVSCPHCGEHQAW